jgi:hypothetical protein
MQLSIDSPKLDAFGFAKIREARAGTDAQAEAERGDSQSFQTRCRKS